MYQRSKSWLPGALESPQNQAQISQALINVAANIFGIIIVMNLYYCYLLIQSYWTPIVGAVLFSIALRGLKRAIANDIQVVTSESAPIFWKQIPMMYYERFREYFIYLWVQLRKRYSSAEATPSKSSVSSAKQNLSRSQKRKRKMDLRQSAPAIPRESLSSSGTVPRDITTQRKRQRTFPFLLVLLGIVLAFAFSLPIVVYLALGIFLVFVLICHAVLYLFGLNTKFARFVNRNSNTIASTATIMILLGSGFMLGAFFLVNCSLEATRAATDFYSFVDSQVFSNPEFQEYVASLGLQSEAKEAADQVYQWYLEKRQSLEATGFGRLIQLFNVAELSGEGSVTKRFATHLMMSYSNVSVHDIETMIQSAGFTGFKIYDLQDPFLKLTQIFNGLSNVVFTIVKLSFFSIIYMLSQLISVSVLFFVFITILFYLLSNTHGVIFYAVQVLPINEEGKPKIHAKLKQAVRDTLACSFEVCVTHAFLTWLSFKLCGVQYVYISTLLSGVFAMIPYLSSWVVSIPAGFQLWLAGRAPLGITLVVFHLGTYFLVDPWIYELVQSMHPSFTSLSILMGFYAFDLPGVIFGPFLVLAAIITREIFTEIYRQNSGGIPASTSWKPEHPTTDTDEDDQAYSASSIGRSNRAVQIAERERERPSTEPNTPARPTLRSSDPVDPDDVLSRLRKGKRDELDGYNDDTDDF